MNVKLTLSMDEEIIQKAKKYAREQDQSLSSLFENYLKKLLHELPEEKVPETSLVKQLSGIIQLPTEYDYQEDYRDYLTEKYK